MLGEDKYLAVEAFADDGKDLVVAIARKPKGLKQVLNDKKAWKSADKELQEKLAKAKKS